MYNMIEKSKKNMKNRKGFTLIELIVVIVIIGILAAIIIPRFTSVTDSAKEKSVIANQRIIVSAVQMYMADKDGALPETQDAVLPYLPDEKMPTGNPTGATYTYSYASNVGTVTAELSGSSTTFAAMKIE